MQIRRILEHREQYRHNFLRCDLAVQVFVDHHKLLGVEQANRDHRPSASLELVDQRRRDQVRRADSWIGAALPADAAREPAAHAVNRNKRSGGIAERK